MTVAKLRGKPRSGAGGPGVDRLVGGRVVQVALQPAPSLAKAHVEEERAWFPPTPLDSRERAVEDRKAATDAERAGRLCVSALPYYWDTNPGMIGQASHALAQVLADGFP